jgi:hypothetical protein
MEVIGVALIIWFLVARWLDRRSAARTQSGARVEDPGVSSQTAPKYGTSHVPTEIAPAPEMLKLLTVYYDSKGILPTNFHCRHATACSADSPRFTSSKATSLGTEYERGNGPRLLFLSLDSGSADSDPKRRTFEALRAEEHRQDVNNLPKNKHWYLTHLMAWELLRPFHPQLTVAKMRPYFAHVNSAKCCQNNPHRGKAASVLFDNCRSYIPGELRILMPDIIVTQGGEAKDVIVKAMRLVKHDVRDVDGAHCETGIVQLTSEKQTLWIQTYHPNNYGRFHPQRRKCWSLYANAVQQFVTQGANTL